MTIHNLVTPSNIRNNVTCVLLHHSTQYAKSAAGIIAEHWNHHTEADKERNIKSMVEDSRDNLPCHLALLLKVPCKGNDGDDELDDTLEVVGHVKLVRAAGKGDGSNCISYSLVVAEAFRGLGLGRILTEEGENYVRSLNISYMYLSTSDKVTFYEHIGYKQCERISSLGENSKRLNTMQLNALENLFAKRANVDNSTGNTWLRKRLIQEYPLKDLMDFTLRTKKIASSLDGIVEYSEDEASRHHYFGFINQLRWQQQTGPSCGISALNMVQGFLEDTENRQGRNIESVDTKKGESINSYCNCIGEMKHIDSDVTCDSTLEYAMNLGVTNDGEMFCAYNLAYVSEVYKKMNLIVREINDSNPLDILRSICKQCPVIIPYDRNNYYIPKQLEGKFAHWAVIVGIILPATYKDVISHGETRSCKETLSFGTELDMYDVSYGFDIKEVSNLEGSLADDLMLICMHGMCERCFVCSYSDMVASNKQLRNSKSKFYLASEGLLHLRDKIVFLAQ